MKLNFRHALKTLCKLYVWIEAPLIYLWHSIPGLKRGKQIGHLRAEKSLVLVKLMNGCVCMGGAPWRTVYLGQIIYLVDLTIHDVSTCLFQTRFYRIKLTNFEKKSRFEEYRSMEGIINFEQVWISWTTKL